MSSAPAGCSTSTWPWWLYSAVPRRRPALNALTILLLVASLLAVTIGYLGSHGDKGGELDVFAGEA